MAITGSHSFCAYAQMWDATLLPATAPFAAVVHCSIAAGLSLQHQCYAMHGISPTQRWPDVAFWCEIAICKQESAFQAPLSSSLQ